jgi:energy-converting hydrogenase Eha subunit A
MAYNRTTWQDSPSTSTPINAANLNNIETGVLGVESTLNALAGTVGASIGTAGTAVNLTATQGSVTAIAGTAGTAYNLTSTYGSVSSHVSATTSVHGITNTANLVYTDNATLGSVSTINASLGSIAGTVSNLVTQPFGTVNVNYTLGTADSGKLIKSTSSTAIVVTLPPSGSVNFPIGQRVDFIQTGTGTVTFGTASSGTAGTVTILSTPSLILRTRYSSATIIKTDTNEWVVVGDMY